MCHAAAARHRSRGHDEKFFAQLERLLRVRAPITVANPEAGGAHILKDLVPTSFPLARSKMERIEARRANAIEQHIKATNREVRVIGDDDIIQEFEDHAWELSWKEALITIGLENGLTDETGRPLNARFRRLLVRARRAHTRGRRLYLDEQRRKSDPEKFLREWADRLFGKDGWVRTENGKYRKKNSGTGGFK